MAQPELIDTDSRR